MNKEDVKVGMSVTLTKSYSTLKAGETYEVECDQPHSNKECWILKHNVSGTNFLAPWAKDFEAVPVKERETKTHEECLDDEAGKWGWIDYDSFLASPQNSKLDVSKLCRDAAEVYAAQFISW